LVLLLKEKGGGVRGAASGVEIILYMYFSKGVGKGMRYRLDSQGSNPARSKIFSI
jgi:hypothetical protein